MKKERERKKEGKKERKKERKEEREKGRKRERKKEREKRRKRNVGRRFCTTPISCRAQQRSEPSAVNVERDTFLNLNAESTRLGRTDKKITQSLSLKN
jgi:CO/xanthine dehydrogenase Mo-binding subunit